MYVKVNYLGILYAIYYLLSTNCIDYNTFVPLALLSNLQKSAMQVPCQYISIKAHKV